MIYSTADTGVTDIVENDVVGELEGIEKWPVWVRLIIIISLSALLWAGILSGVSALLG